ncbi:hypothetical protein [Streptomyces sp. ME19-01-6]|uniref:DUF6197 family protein n=1 Tax=Streptomyces sp. ME19-01-6 TaxID=3028686 RepID=UPI0029B8A40A|nr:hypothetical protein [Streptomyces sp. ME19-01-6]MDX3230539.1 hypothetical protein [Streptomyces sp. ME19-01-6]
MSTNLAVIYQQAADIIRTNGHNKGSYYRVPETSVGIQLSPAEYPVCAAGALNVALTGSPAPAYDGDDIPVVVEAARRFMRHVTPGYRGASAIWDLAVWNDNRERTAADVIAAFEEAAREVRAA